MKDYFVEVKIKNNRIIRRIQIAGFSSIVEFCRYYELNYGLVVNLISISVPAKRVSGEWTKIALDLSSVFHVEPEELFTEAQAWATIKSKITREFDEEQVISLSAPEAQKLISQNQSPEDIAAFRLMAMKVVRLLSPRQQIVLNKKYGLDGNPEQTTKQIAAEMGKTVTWVNAIENSALTRARFLARASRITTGMNGEPPKAFVMNGKSCIHRVDVNELCFKCDTNTGKPKPKLVPLYHRPQS